MTDVVGEGLNAVSAADESREMIPFQGTLSAAPPDFDEQRQMIGGDPRQLRSRDLDAGDFEGGIHEDVIDPHGGKPP